MKIPVLFACLLVQSLLVPRPTYAGTPKTEAADRRAEFRTEIVSPGGVSIENAHTTWWRGRVIVGGFVEKKFGFSGRASNSHLDLIVLDKDGQPLSTTPTNYYPRPVAANYRGRIGRAKYAEKLPSIPPVGAKIRVFHHQSPIEECRAANRSARSGTG